MHDGRQARGAMSALEFGDVITVDLPDDGYVDHEYLRDVFREPRTYLPLRRRGAPRDLEDLPREVESRLAHRAKVASLVAATTMLLGAVIAAAVLAQQPARAGGTGSEGDDSARHARVVEITERLDGSVLAVATMPRAGLGLASLNCSMSSKPGPSNTYSCCPRRTPAPVSNRIHSAPVPDCAPDRAGSMRVA